MMKKTLLCLFMALFILSSLCLCAFATDETTSVEYSEWFGGTSEVVGSYTIFRNVGSSTTDVAPYAVWLYACGATTASNSLGDFSFYRSASDSEVRTGPLWSPDGVHVCERDYSSGTTYIGGLYTLRSTTIDSSDGYEQALLIPDCSVTPTMVTVGTDGFVTSGFLSSLGIVGDVLGFILGSPILALVGLSVGVFLIGWGITSVKDLIKGY